MKRNARFSVLVADDEYVISRCVSFMLKKEGFDCRAVSDGLSALETMREDPPDMLILDLDMPRLNGYQVCEQMRLEDALRDVHVLVLTAKGQPITRNWRSRIAADHFMLKPFDPRVLLEHVRSVAAGETAESGDEEATGDREPVGARA